MQVEANKDERVPERRELASRSGLGRNLRCAGFYLESHYSASHSETPFCSLLLLLPLRLSQSPCHTT